MTYVYAPDTSERNLNNAFIDNSKLDYVELIDIHRSEKYRYEREKVNNWRFDVKYRLFYRNGSIRDIAFLGCENPFRPDLNLRSPANSCLFNLMKYDIKYAELGSIEVIREPNVKEMTISEIEKELGHPVKIIKENSDD